MLVTIATYGPVVQERAVALVGLGDEVLAGAVVGVRADLGDLPADHERRVEPGVLQDRGDHRGGGGLAVGAGDRDRPPAGHRRGERLGAVQHPQPARAAPRPAPGGRPGSRWSRRPCPRRPGWTLRGACGWCRPAPAGRPAPATPCSSLPETGMPRVSSSRARPLMPTPPTPIRCTRPRSSAVSAGSASCRAHADPPPPRGRTRAAPRRRRGGRTGRGRAHRGQPRRGRRPAGPPSSRSTPGSARRRRPAARRRPRPRAARCAAARRCRTAAERRSAGRPDRGHLGEVIAPPRPSTRSAAA